MNRHEFDGICPNCGFPLPLAKPRGKAPSGVPQSSTCPHCRYDFRTGAAPRPRAYLTSFGHGVCGMVAGAGIGAAWALVLPYPLQQPMMVLLPLACGLMTALAAAWLGRHLAIEHHRGYELLLLSADAGGMAAAGVALAGVYAGGVLLGVGLVVAAVTRLLLARLPQLDRMDDSTRFA